MKMRKLVEKVEKEKTNYFALKTNMHLFLLGLLVLFNQFHTSNQPIFLPKIEHNTSKIYANKNTIMIFIIYRATRKSLLFYLRNRKNN
jgi:hypothetical protein